MLELDLERRRVGKRKPKPKPSKPQTHLSPGLPLPSRGPTPAQQQPSLPFLSPAQLTPLSLGPDPPARPSSPRPLPPGSLRARPHLSAPPSPSRRAATRSRDLRPKLPQPSFPAPTPRSPAVSFKPPAEPLRSSHPAAQTLAVAARYPGARSRTTAAVGERFLEQLLATGYTQVTLTLPPPPQERPAPIQGVQEPGAAPIRPSSASSATSRRRPSWTTFLRCISGHHNP